MAIPADPEQIAAFIQQQVQDQGTAQVAAQVAAAVAAVPPAAPVAAPAEPLPAHNIKPATPQGFSGSSKEDVDL